VFSCEGSLRKSDFAQQGGFDSGLPGSPRTDRELLMTMKQMLLDMRFQPITEEMRNRLIAAGLYGIPKE
jgi:hypothetical protein